MTNPNVRPDLTELQSLCDAFGIMAAKSSISHEAARSIVVKVPGLIAHIERLQNALLQISGQAICYGMSADESELREWLRFISETAESTLYQGTSNE